MCENSLGGGAPALVRLRRRPSHRRTIDVAVSDVVLLHLTTVDVGFVDRLPGLDRDLVRCLMFYFVQVLERTGRS